jgi:hypothetical protein
MRPLTSYTRNNLFHLLAGGVRGLSYFTHDSRTKEAWAEMNRVTPHIRRIEPVQARIQPRGRRVALMHSVTSDIFNQGNWLLLPYAYANLIQAHYDVDIICEEEVLDGICKDYDAVLLYRTMYLRQSVYDALAKQAKEGAKIYLDTSVPFDIPGCKRLNVDIGMGKLASKDLPPEGAHVATPGPQDYGYPERIKAVADTMKQILPPMFECEDERIVAHPFEIDGVKYIWFVNALSGEEYRMCQNRMQALRTDEAKQEVIDWEKKELREHPTFEAELRFTSLSGVPYDLWKGGRVDVRSEDGKAVLPVSMDRFGGTLIAFYPRPIAAVTLNAPKEAKPMQTVSIEANVSDEGGAVSGCVPVEIKLIRPDSELSPLSRVVGTEKGKASINWTPAVNDPMGKWQVTATELASGKTISAEIELKP